MIFFLKQMVKVSAFYLENLKSFIQKNYDFGRSLYIGQESSNRWRFVVPIFREGFFLKTITTTRLKKGERFCSGGYQIDDAQL
jgi:hypothetical protein